MRKLLHVGTLFVAIFSAPDTHAGQRLTVRVWPAVALAPALLTIRAMVEPSAQNRALSVEIDSAAYSRRSEIPLDGERSPRLTVVELRDVPTGLYEVRAVLVGASGSVATSSQLVKVQPSVGAAR